MRGDPLAIAIPLPCTIHCWHIAAEESSRIPRAPTRPDSAYRGAKGSDCTTTMIMSRNPLPSTLVRATISSTARRSRQPNGRPASCTSSLTVRRLENMSTRSSTYRVRSPITEAERRARETAEGDAVGLLEPAGGDNPSTLQPSALPSAGRAECLAVSRVRLAAAAPKRLPTQLSDHSEAARKARNCNYMSNSQTERGCCGAGTLARKYGGEGGIRTHGGRKTSTVFETARFNHSRTSPQVEGLRSL